MKTIQFLLLASILLIASCSKDVDTPSCNDGIQNGNETGVDCGGSCSPCTTNPTCSDGIQNGTETGVDCGGNCPPCSTNPTCSDGIQNGNETGIDCGGDCPPCISNKNIDGHAQKGPFLNGSSITLSELDTNFAATGKVFSTQILDNTGVFQFNNVALVSNYVTIRVDGFYFNEVCGGQSSSQITLNGIADISSNTSLNLNVLTHLEKARVEYLVGNGSSFSSAKQQAQNEILQIFEITPSGTVNSSELLDISHNSEGDAILIAISSILQGFRTESEFSDLMANIITDIRTDGVLNSNSLGAELLAHAMLLDTLEIKGNIETRYNNLGISVSVPSFGKFISGFISNTSFSNTATVINYPASGVNGLNYLDINYSGSYTQHSPHSLAANLPVNCLSLKIVISRVNSSMPNCGFLGGCWAYVSTSVQNWSITVYDQVNHIQTFTSSGINSDLNLEFWDSGTFLIEYFENGSATPTRTKTITVI